MISVCCYGTAIYTSLFLWCVFTNPQSNHNYQKKSCRETCAVCIHLHPPLQLPPAVFSVYTRTDADSFLMKAGTIFAFLVYEKTFQEHLNSAEGLPGRCGTASEQQFKMLTCSVKRKKEVETEPCKLEIYVKTEPCALPQSRVSMIMWCRCSKKSLNYGLSSRFNQ